MKTITALLIITAMFTGCATHHRHPISMMPPDNHAIVIPDPPTTKPDCNVGGDCQFILEQI